MIVGCDLCGASGWTARVRYRRVVLRLCRKDYTFYLASLFPELVRPEDHVPADLRHAWAT